MAYTADEIIKILEANGFHFVRQNGSHRIYRDDEGKNTVVVPYHKGDLKLGTTNSILRQAGLK